MLYHLCDVSKGNQNARVYLPDTQAVVGKLVAIDVNGVLTKGFRVEEVRQSIESQFVEDNHMAFKAMSANPKYEL